MLNIGPMNGPLAQNTSNIITQHLPASLARDKLRAATDMIIVAFFYLLRPGEYTDAPLDTTTVTLGGVQLSIGDVCLDVLTTSEATLFQSRFLSFTFTTQNNGVGNEVI